ncbi:MAG: chemotaxis signal transduction protein CheV [Lysobacterales bacterium]|nr:MAG: chemotaxis signal transduction protein CheV [Xanthomonadales bacterium]
MAKASILLESGTNEVEILEFILGGQSFGVNVLKIQAIERYDPKRVTRIHHSHPSVIGTLRFRDHCLTMIDLGKEMDTSDRADEPGFESGKPENGEGTAAKLVLVMEFNQLKTAFLVHGVNRIHRVSWESINPLSPYLSSSDSKFTGSLQIKGREILLVDMEKIVTEILPRGQFQFSVEQVSDEALSRQRAERTILLAEDSAVLRKHVAEELHRGGYTSLRAFANGRECYDELVRLTAEADAAGRPVSDSVAALISDIEMPAMDGLALCRWVKQNRQTQDMPVIMFSSLINDQIVSKCRAVGADAYIAKPQFVELVNLLDQHTGLLEPAGV